MPASRRWLELSHFDLQCGWVCGIGYSVNRLTPVFPSVDNPAASAAVHDFPLDVNFPASGFVIPENTDMHSRRPSSVVWLFQAVRFSGFKPACFLFFVL